MKFDHPLSLSPGLSDADFQLIFQAIMQLSKDGLFIVDHLGNVVMVNKATEEMFDFRADEVLGRNVRDLVREGFYDPSVSLLVLKKKEAISVIQTTRSQKRMLSTGVPIFDKQGEVRFVLVNDRDISLINQIADSLEIEEASDNFLRIELSELGLAANELGGLIIHSESMQNILKTVSRAARFDIPLILTGESGVGKSMIAKIIHQLSDRREGSFVDLNCGSIAASLLESELFGHEKGAFTGAAPSGKRGLLETADEGTLFLDEIGEIPMALQVKLLKFFDNKELMRVGGVKTLKVNARIIAATNRDLDEMVKRGRFRSDLYFRLNVVPIAIPPLRDRPEEIEPLIQFFLERFNRRFQCKKVITKSARMALQEYRFPGNVRELENLVQRLVTMTEGDFIQTKHLPDMLRKTIASTAAQTNTKQRSYQEEVNAFEIKIIKDAIRKYGSQRKAAQVLGLSQSTLSRKLKAGHPPHITH